MIHFPKWVTITKCTTKTNTVVFPRGFFGNNHGAVKAYLKSEVR